MFYETYYNNVKHRHKKKKNGGIHIYYLCLCITAIVLLYSITTIVVRCPMNEQN